MATESPDIDVETETDRLYQLPVDAFVEARNALAARLKTGGNKESAARVKALARPNLSAWAANQVYWSARADFDALVDSVGRLHDAQVQGRAGADLRDAMKARREAQDRVTRAAANLLARTGHGTNPDTLHRVSKTLEALAAHATGGTHTRPGRLVQDLEPPGFDAFASVAVAHPPASPRVEPASQDPAEPSSPARPVLEAETQSGRDGVEDRAKEVERLRAVLAESEKHLDRARREAREAAGALSVAEKRAEAARDELEEAKRRLERARDRAASTTEDERLARKKAEERAVVRDAAEAERDAALLALRALE